jgi:hypothetical protein
VVESRETTHDRDQRVLGGVGGVGVVPRDSAAQRVDPVVVASQQLVEGGRVAALRSDDELGIGSGGVDRLKIVIGGTDRAVPRTNPSRG